MAKVLKMDLEGLAEASRVIADGGLVCFPTDTLYGLGCDPLNPSAVERALTAKGPRTKPMPVLVRALEDAERLVNMSEGAKRLADKFWPGPLTIVVHAKASVPKVLAPDQTLGVRSPNHASCQQFLALCSGSLTGTSANVTGKPPASSAQEALDQLGERVDVILDGGKSPLGIASTVVDLTKSKLVLSREGPISRREILRCLKGSR